MSELTMLLEDCRELLPVLRLSDERLSVLREARGGPIRLAVEGYGRWRPLQDGEEPESQEHLAILGPLGRIEISLSDGSTFIGGDTGWRDVTEAAKREDPDVEISMIRRVHDNVYFTQSGGAPLAIEATVGDDSLQRRVFREGTVDLLDALPAFVRELDGFRPSDTQDRDSSPSSPD